MDVFCDCLLGINLFVVCLLVVVSSNRFQAFAELSVYFCSGGLVLDYMNVVKKLVLYIWNDDETCGESETRAGSGAESEAEAGAGSRVGSEAQSEAGVGSGPQSEAGSGARSESETTAGSGSESESGAGSTAGSGSESGAGSTAGSGAESEAGSGSVSVRREGFTTPYQTLYSLILGLQLATYTCTAPDTPRG